MDETSPWTPLLYNLAGINRPPKARQAFQQYMAESYDTEIAPVVEARWKSTFLEDDGVTLKTKKNHNAAFRSKIAREMYSKLSEERQDGIKRRLKEAAQQAKDEYARTMKSGPSQAPEDRQRCIDTVGPFVNELLSRVAEYTGLQSVMVLGGPIPSSGGELETRVFGYSENPDRAFQDSEQFDTKVLDFMKEFLHTAFTPEECAAAALPSAKGKGKERAEESEERRKERKEKKERKRVKKRKREEKEEEAARGRDKRAREIQPSGDEEDWEDDWEDDMDTPASLQMPDSWDCSPSQGPSHAGMSAQHSPPSCRCSPLLRYPCLCQMR